MAEKIKASLDAPDEGLVGVLRDFQFGEGGLVQRAHGPPQLPAGLRQHQDVVHVAHVVRLGATQALIEDLQIQGPEQRDWAAPEQRCSTTAQGRTATVDDWSAFGPGADLRHVTMAPLKQPIAFCTGAVV